MWRHWWMSPQKKLCKTWGQKWNFSSLLVARLVGIKQTTAKTIETALFDGLWLHHLLSLSLSRFVRFSSLDDRKYLKLRLWVVHRERLEKMIFYYFVRFEPRSHGLGNKSFGNSKQEKRRKICMFKASMSSTKLDLKWKKLLLRRKKV